ncbi:hypothetical protein GA0070616_0150 [Micromonospora nigra]|uniref:AbiJ-NTD3 domain-containing protein n=1 Tax=Micromonospora nigra TaxID=145857 RepID=A0A1C6R780_9ACTN|nr:hypothetical protein [Micromonospora nigra]SCL12861.1 hypothetical protein GA0070616_0044 [Micromonospora nigra]SCL13177.1 hypothetical protein GA0070616_0150 [Micromonospora nigra]
MNRDWKLDSELSTVSELLVEAGHQRAANLVSLVQAAETIPSPSAAWLAPATVVLRVRPMFMALFEPADLRAIGAQFDKLRIGVGQHEVTIAPMLVDPMARVEAGTRGATSIQLREAIAEALHQVKSYDLPTVCRSFGLADGEIEDAHYSKRGYVRARIQTLTDEQLAELGTRVVEVYYLPHLWGLLQLAGARRGGVRSTFKNLIFAADGPKPELVLVDAVSNTIQITKNGQFCLVYDRPLPAAGLSWADLVDWWRQTRGHPGVSERDAANGLHARLVLSLDRDRDPSAGRGPEYLMFQTYAALLKEHGFGLPALIPQVYLHYDPRTRAQRHAPGPLARQRMDFLMLLRDQRRLVIEIDGKQHYAEGDLASPRLYAEMVAEDRDLQLAGYDVVRFGGYEFRDADAARATVTCFFERVLRQHGYLPDQTG